MLETRSPAEIAKGRKDEATDGIVRRMATKGCGVAFRSEGKTYYQAAAFIRVFSSSSSWGKATGREKKIAAHPRVQAGLQRRQRAQPISFPLSRVISVDRKISVRNAVHTYDQVATYISKYDPSVWEAATAAMKQC